MESFKFTKSKLAELPAAPKGKQVDYHDSHVKGLRLRVGASGIKTFCVVRKVKGAFIRATLGRFPEITIEQARAKALDKLGDIGMTGRNPNVVSREESLSNVTLREALELYIKTRGHRLKPATANQYRGLLQNFSGDWLDRPMANISRDDVFNRHKKITDGTVWYGECLSKLRAGVGKGSRSQADLWGRALRAVYNFANDNYRDQLGSKLLPEPPTVVLSSKRQWHGLVRKNTRIRNKDLGRWLKSVEFVRKHALDIRDDHALSVCDAIDMALFTGLRRGEVFGLEWERVNLAGGYFWIDKTKNGEPLELPITKTLQVIFERRLQFKKNSSRFVFPALRGGVITDPRKVIDKIVAATSSGEFDGQLPINFTCHDARRTFATIAELSGVGTYILKRLMNHRSGRVSDVTAGYISLPVEELVEPAARIEMKIMQEAGIQVPFINTKELLASLSQEDKSKLLEELLRERE
ncbi:site-specific integrase [Salmonella enterica]|uniref:Site-specific integrase n=1 Tax=Salmonella montevideo TaxID=115981 RepID=A0A624AZ16_SALMO|nr:DUF4102 domain-containing protein [Salmonella enterica]ECZ5259860.1 site-specific integrase [Salmonella enterica subsp. enterica serovar Montevideo]EAX2495739.1 site-specific integrase [Salmonella enterica]EAX2506419.1 site-specific integrase [Salmonella enterica]EAX3036603.1 site-specific integrase [Salmonella enterica]